MINLSRALARQYRAVLRRALMADDPRGLWPVVLCRADGTGLTLESRQRDNAVRYRQDRSLPEEPLCFPGALLAEIEGRTDVLVALEAVNAEKGRARWAAGLALSLFHSFRRQFIMPSLRSLIDPAGRSLAFHVNRLKAKLDELRERLRETAARLLGETVASVVEQTVRHLLTVPTTTLPPVYRPRDYRPQPSSWADPDEAEYLYDPHEPHASYRRDELDEPEAKPEPEPEETPRLSRWRQALAIGLRAAAWWLQRWTGSSSLGVALGLGITATAVVLAGGPTTVTGAGLIASALGLASLVAVIHSGMAVLAVPVIT